MHRTILYVLTSITCLFTATSYAEAAVIFRPVFNGGLVGYWDFNEGEGNTAYDRSGNANHGTLSNMQSGEDRVNSKSGLGQALDFDGDDDYVNVGNAGSGIQTISFWMYAHDTTTRDIIDLDGTDQIQLNGGSQIVATDFPAATIYVDGQAGSTVTPNTWHHVLITDTTGVNATALEIGRVTTLNEFDGLLDDVRLYTRALTPDEVRRIYNITHVVISKTRIIISDGLVGHWTFDGKVTGPTWTEDVSGNGNSGTLTNGPKPTSGKIGQALDFDGTDDCVTVPDSSLWDFAGKDATISLWMRGDSDGSGTDIFLDHFSGGSPGSGWSFQINASNRMFFEHRGSNSLFINNNSKNWRDDQWHHLVGVVRDVTSDMGEFYIDGQLSGSDTFSGLIDNDQDMGIGGLQTCSSSFNGTIDDVRIYNRALSADEIKRLYNGTKESRVSVTTSAGSLSDGLVGHWSFDGKVTGPTWTDDVSGNGNSGTLTNGPQPTGGKIGQAMEFDGEDAYIAVGNAGSGIQTIGFWIYAHDTTTRDIIDLDGTDQIQLNGGDQITATDFPAATIYVDGQIGDSVTPNTWHHILVTDTVGVNATALEIGRVTTTNEFDGILDDVRLYDRVLTPSEIQRLSVMGGR